MNLFVYDDALRPDVQNILRIQPQTERIAECEGKLFVVHRQPIMLNLQDITRNRGCRRVFGAIWQIPDENEENVLYAMDNYKGCSMSRLGVNHPQDLTYRTIKEVYPIVTEDIHDLENLTYRYQRGIRCVTWLGNPNHEALLYSVKVDRHNKCPDGYYKKGFKQLLIRKELVDG